METGHYSGRLQSLDCGLTGKKEKNTAQKLAQFQRETKVPPLFGASGGFPSLSLGCIRYQHP